MKTSNYIILSFFICLFGGIFILFLAAKLDPRADQKQELVTNEKPLDNFSVVVAEAGANIRIKTGETPKIGLYYHKGDSCVLPAYSVRNDTLFVQSNPIQNKYWAAEVFGRQIRGVEGREKSQVHIDEISTDTLLVTLNKAELRCFPGKNSASFSLRLTASNSNVNIGESTINNLELQLVKTRIDGWNNHIGNISGKLMNESRISIERANKIGLEADSTSTYRLEK